MKIADKIQLMGMLFFSIVDAATNKVISTHTTHNIITDNGYHAAAQALAGVSGSAITTLAIGEDFTVPASGDTEITGVTVPITSVEYPDNFSVRFNFQIDEYTANEMNLVEFGLVTQDGRLFSRLVRGEIIAKTDAIKIIGGYIINI